MLERTCLIYRSNLENLNNNLEKCLLIIISPLLLKYSRNQKTPKWEGNFKNELMIINSPVYMA